MYYAAILAAFIFFCGLAYERWNLRAELRGVEKLANWYARNLFRDTTAFYESLEKQVEGLEERIASLPDRMESFEERYEWLRDQINLIYSRLDSLSETTCDIMQFANTIRKENANV